MQQAITYFTCRRCKTEKPLTDFYANKTTGTLHAAWCKNCCCEWRRYKYASEDGTRLRERDRASARQRYAANLETERRRSREWHRRHAKDRLGRVQARKIRTEVLNYYGHSCACCGEGMSEFLCIDHINGNGTEHRKTLKTSIYRWLKRNNYPEGFQVLCHNCNMAKSFYGQCPHDTVRIESLVA